MPLDDFNLPGPKDKIAILGRTGSGKTHFAVWTLSQCNWPFCPWLIVDYKRDELIAEIPNLKLLKLGQKLPREPGLYAVRPNPQDEAQVEALLWSIWKRGRTGLYVDEGHMLPDKEALQAILQQGRSKSIPVILLSQRPVWLNRFALTEATFFSVFSLNDRRDRQTVNTFLPNIDLNKRLPKRYSYYYDVEEDRAFTLAPVPPASEFMQRFIERNPRHVTHSYI